MRCEELWENLEELGGTELPAPLRKHLTSCPACQSYARDWRLTRAGLRLLASEPLPEPSVGFAARLVRRLDGLAEVGRSSEQFLEQAGRRFVYASLLLALTVLLALLLPSSGPLRATTTPDLYFAGQEALSSESDPILAGEPAESKSPVLPGSREGSASKQK